MYYFSVSNEAQNFQEAILRELKAPVSTEIEKGMDICIITV